MDKITHKIDEKSNVVIKAKGDANGRPYIYEAMLSPQYDQKGNAHISKSDINTFGIEESSLIKEKILEVIKKEKGTNGESPLKVDND